MNNLPIGYTLCEYIESDGTNFVDTGLLGKSGLQVQCKCSFSDVTSVHNVFGVLEGTNRLFIQYDNAEGLLYAYGAWNDTNASISANEAYEMDATFNVGSQSFKLDGTELYSGTNSTNISTSLNAYLFALNLNGTPNFKAKMRLYYCRIYDNGSLVRDYIPCQSSEGYYGLYDKVNNVFYQSVSEYGFTGKWAEDKKLLVSPAELRRRLIMSSTLLKELATGIYIEDVDGKLWDLDNYDKSVRANGVAVITDNVKFVVAVENAHSSTLRWGGYGTLVDDVVATDDIEEAKIDFEGKKNTEKILSAQLYDDYVLGAPPAEKCRDYIFPNGESGYLGSAGEWSALLDNLTLVNNAMTLIGKSNLSSYYWTSTQVNGKNAWGVNRSSETIQSFIKTRGNYVRAFARISKIK